VFFAAVAVDVVVATVAFVALVVLVAALAATLVVAFTFMALVVARVLLATPKPTWAKEIVAAKEAASNSIDCLIVFIDPNFLVFVIHRIV
jgi:hypothetical protein